MAAPRRRSILAALVLLPGAARASLDVPLPIGRSVALPDGGRLHVHALVLRRHAIAVGVTLTGGRQDLWLALAPPVLVASDGTEHPFLPPAANPSLLLPHGVALEGQLLFAGHPAPGVTRLTLRFNPGYGAGARAPETSVELDLPTTVAPPAPDMPPADATRLTPHAIGPAEPLAPARR
ncbi:MAG: hypothetical protein ACK4PG_03590 [Acetobacteraceae bacterium]